MKKRRRNDGEAEWPMSSGHAVVSAEGEAVSQADEADEADYITRGLTGELRVSGERIKLAGVFVYVLLKTPLSSILGFMKFGLTITITLYE
ncbi:unnamed protein product [Leptosia nina]|uniref:Uncharacterized protein n=1 Tax=Leptosia nina TaxID=320188 RepID=A0AAV1JPP7_9NEOP